MEKSFTKRLQELAGITEESKMISRIDQEIEKAKESGVIDDDNDFESGSDEWMEFMGTIYQVPFEWDEDEDEDKDDYPFSKFYSLIDKKAKEINFPTEKFMDYLKSKGLDWM
tara:strand:- start:35 stop:370 length:336 start_codon:yes stop_codon:yes gene_type:complete